ncbi:hypothetical protein QBC45DRAFT_58182 [Copromyces sp. CBS 386.78]|nr:hypothetical protein QBC45DRAFT_58182 [Copromyces sp. CBS 386.78]
MATSTETAATAVNNALDFYVSPLRRLLTAVRYFCMFLVATVLFWKGVAQLLVHLAVPSFAPANRQQLAVETRKQAAEGASPNASTDSPPSLISPGSSTYSSVIGDLDLDPDDNFGELPPLDYIPPTPEDIKRWVELSFEERRKVHDMQYNGLNWMSWSPPPSPSLPPRRPLPKGVPEWREEWSDFDLPPNPPHIPSPEDLRRWWGEATEEDRARINRISTDGLNWRMWAPHPQRPCENGEPVVWSGIGPWAGLEENGDDDIANNSSGEQTVDQQPLVQRQPQKGLPPSQEEHRAFEHEGVELAVADVAPADSLMVAALSSVAEQ